MELYAIGAQIAKLRKEKGATQEDLANFTQVSAQAVSKWENGGVPDAALLPKIAEFFGVSIDLLFGRDTSGAIHWGKALNEYFASIARENRLEAAFEFCWLLQRAFFGDAENAQTDLTLLRENMQDSKTRKYSVLRSDDGFVSVGLSSWLPYFLLAPAPKDAKAGLLDGADFPALFADLGDAAVFNALVFLYGREKDKAFTPHLLVKHLSLAPEKAAEVVAVLQKYRLVKATQIEMDDAVQEIYTFEPTPDFPALLLFARNLILPQQSYYYFSGGGNKPYFA